MKVKKIGFLFGAAVVFIIGYFVGHYIGWNVGYKSGFDSGADTVEKEWTNYGKEHPAQHHYEFKQNGVSIFRFDLDTGESCWLQLGKADAEEEDHLASPMQQCSE